MSPPRKVSRVREFLSSRMTGPGTSRWLGKWRRWNGAGVFFGLAIACALLPVLRTSERVSPSSIRADFQGWGGMPLPTGVSMIKLDARTERFAADFPGKIGVFSDGQRTWIVRWIVQPTRKLHSSSDCLRAAGYRVVPQRASIDAEGRLWSSSSALRGGEKMKVSERITGTHGGFWTDVSAWFWQSTWDRASGPWWAVTKLEPMT